MKEKYLDTIERFLADQGGMIRFYRRQWWIIKEGYWDLGGRAALDQMLIGYLQAFAPPLIVRDLNQADMNQICAFLARRMFTSALPARAMAPGEDQKMTLWGVRVKPRLGSE